MVASIPTQHTLLGLTPVFQAALPAGDTYLAAGSPTLQVKNSGSAPVTVTIAAINNCSQGFKHPLSFVVPPTALPFEYGPVGTLYYQDASANVEISYSSTVQTVPAAAVVASGAGGVPNGTYRCQVTFLNASGETSGSAEAIVTVASQQISWSAIPIGPAGTTGRNLYRIGVLASDSAKLTESATISVGPVIPAADPSKLSEGASIAQTSALGQTRLVTALADNTTTTFTDNVADSALGVGIPTANTANVVTVAVTAA
jgi:hypothetical protein